MQTFEFTFDRSAFSVDSLCAPSGDTAYWLSRSPAERFAAIEFLRQTVYGHDPNSGNFQRTFEVIDRSDVRERDDLKAHQAASGRATDLAELQELP